MWLINTSCKDINSISSKSSNITNSDCDFNTTINYDIQ